MSFSPVFNTPPTLPIKPSRAPLPQPLRRPLRGDGWGRGWRGAGGGALRDTVRRVTSALTAGVTRGSLHFTEVQESRKASGGIYEVEGLGMGGGEEGGGGAIGRSEGQGGGAVNSRTALKAANLVNGQEHMEGKKAGGWVGWATCTSAGTHVGTHDPPALPSFSTSRPERRESRARTHAHGVSENKPPINRRRR